MFKVKDLRNGKIKTAYAVCGMMFLFYNGIEWYCDDIGNYEPVEETE